MVNMSKTVLALWTTAVLGSPLIDITYITEDCGPADNSDEHYTTANAPDCASGANPSINISMASCNSNTIQVNDCSNSPPVTYTKNASTFRARSCYKSQNDSAHVLNVVSCSSRGKNNNGWWYLL